MSVIEKLGLKAANIEALTELERARLAVEVIELLGWHEYGYGSAMWRLGNGAQMNMDNYRCVLEEDEE